MNDDSLTDHNGLLRYELFEQIIDDLYIILKSHFTRSVIIGAWDTLSHGTNEVNRLKHSILGGMWNIR